MTINHATTICCPKCHSGHVIRVRRPLLVEHFFNLFPLRRYECLSCLATFTEPANKPETPETILMASVNTSTPVVKQTGTKQVVTN